MNRKLKNCSIALSAAGLALVALALAGDPVAATPRVDTMADQRERPTSRRAGRGLAMPYFSFARGIRRIGG